MTTLRFEAVFRFVRQARLYLEVVRGALIRFPHAHIIYVDNHNCVAHPNSAPKDSPLTVENELLFRTRLEDARSTLLWSFGLLGLQYQTLSLPDFRLAEWREYGLCGLRRTLLRSWMLMPRQYSIGQLSKRNGSIASLFFSCLDNQDAYVFVRRSKMCGPKRKPVRRLLVDLQAYLPLVEMGSFLRDIIHPFVFEFVHFLISLDTYAVNMRS